MRHNVRTLPPRRNWLLAAAIVSGIATGFAIGRARRRLRISFAGRTVLITGGSRGLGLVLAREFGREGARVALLARNEQELRRAEADLITRGVQVFTVRCDVRDKRQVDGAVREVSDRFGGIDILINNAGVIQVGPLEHMTVEDFEDALAVHLYGPLFTTLAVLPYMRERQAGRIVNISSVGGKIAVPHLLPYSVSKFALVGLSDGLRAELRKDNILVTTVCPGLMRTGSPGNASFKGKHRREFAWFTIADSLPLVSMDVRIAARRIIEACRRGAPRLILGAHTRAAVTLSEVFPGTAANLLALTNRLLPSSDLKSGPASHLGWESRTKWVPSTLTRLTDQAAEENNERPSW